MTIKPVSKNIENIEFCVQANVRSGDLISETLMLTVRLC